MKMLREIADDRIAIVYSTIRGINRLTTMIICKNAANRAGNWV